MKFSAPDVEDVVTAFIVSVSDELTKNTVQTQLKSGTLTMDVVRVGSSFNVTYTKELHDLVLQKGDEAKVDMALSLFNSAGKKLGEWPLKNAWSSKITGPAVKSEEKQVLVIGFDKI